MDANPLSSREFLFMSRKATSSKLLQSGPSVFSLLHLGKWLNVTEGGVPASSSIYGIRGHKRSQCLVPPEIKLVPQTGSWFRGRALWPYKTRVHILDYNQSFVSLIQSWDSSEEWGERSDRRREKLKCNRFFHQQDLVLFFCLFDYTTLFWLCSLTSFRDLNLLPNFISSV